MYTLVYASLELYLNSPLEMDRPAKRRHFEPTGLYKEIDVDLVKTFNFSSCLICQINNCTSRKLHTNSFSWELAQEYKYADPYQHRTVGPYPNLASEELRARPGSFEILQDPEEGGGPSFACLYAQYKMGKWGSRYYVTSPKTDENYKYMAVYKDTYRDRVLYFKECLYKLSSILCSSDNHYNCVVFPKYIGCGMAGGIWKDYVTLITDFCKKVKLCQPQIEIYIVRKKC